MRTSSAMAMTAAVRMRGSRIPLMVTSRRGAGSGPRGRSAPFVVHRQRGHRNGAAATGALSVRGRDPELEPRQLDGIRLDQLRLVRQRTFHRLQVEARAQRGAGAAV